jgi:hypothetical protein
VGESCSITGSYGVFADYGCRVFNAARTVYKSNVIMVGVMVTRGARNVKRTNADEIYGRNNGVTLSLPIPIYSESGH